MQSTRRGSFSVQEARHTQMRDRASGVHPDVLEHLPPPLEEGAALTYLGVYTFGHGAWHTFCKHLFNRDAANRPLGKGLIHRQIQFKILNLTEVNLAVSFSPQRSFLLFSDMEM